MVELDVYAIATARDVLIVQRLVDVADEVDDKLGGLVPPPFREGRVEQLRRIVLQRTHDAAVLLAVPLEIDIAVGRRLVVSIDEVKHACESAPFGISNRVGPGRHAGEVMFCLVS